MYAITQAKAWQKIFMIALNAVALLLDLSPQDAKYYTEDLHKYCLWILGLTLGTPVVGGDGEIIHQRCDNCCS